MATRILLADDHRIFRQGLRSLLEREGGAEVVAEADDGREAVRLAEKHRPDVVLMDIGMPNLNGVEATRRIVGGDSGVKVVALSIHADIQFVGSMLEAGASGYLLKDCAFEQLSNAIETVMEGRTYLSPKVADIVVDGYVRNVSEAREDSFPELTPREREILQLIAEGNSTKRIAYQLNVSVKTVETHRRNIMEKLDMHSVAQLTKYAVRRGLTSLENE